MTARWNRWSGRVLAAAIVVGTASVAWQGLPGQPVVAASVDEGLVTDGTPTSFADVIEAVQPAVVNIAVTRERDAMELPGWRPFEGPDGPGRSMEEFFRRFFRRQAYEPVADRPGMMRRPQSMGSGFIVDPEGLVVTNNHVVEGGDEIVVTLSDGTRHDAELVGTDQKTDLALLQVDADGTLPYVRFGDSDATRVGDWVIAIGNPFGLGNTATTGIVSARGRDIRSGPFDDFLQIDAPINQGNSGGPLFDMNGTVVGVNTAIFSPNGGNVGIGFAIPATQAAPVVEALQADGRVDRGWLGVEIQSIDETLAEALGLESTDGALVARVVDDGPADRAGLLAGDVVTSVDGEPVEDVRDLVHRVAAIDDERTVAMDLWRDGEALTLDVAIGSTPAGEMAMASPTEDAEDGSGRLGLRLAPLTDETRARYGTGDDVRGALVVEVDPDGPAAARGLQAGDVITRVGSTTVDDPETAVAEVRRLRDEERPSVVLQIARGDSRRFLAVPFV